MASVPYIFATVPNGQTIPLQYLDADFQYLQDQITGISSGVMTISGGSTGLTPNVPTPGNVILGGVLNIANGGTGANNLTSLQTNIFPSQAGQAGKFLTTDGTNISWSASGGAGVISISGGTTGMSFGAGTGAVTMTGTLAIANGGTGANTLSGLQANIFPPQAGHPGEVLTTDGAGTLSWAAAPPANVIVGTSTITGGATTKVLYDNAGVLGEYGITGTVDVVMSTGPTINQPFTVGIREQEAAVSIAGGVLALDCNVATVFATTLNANITSITFANVPPATQAFSLILSITSGGAFTITWPASVKWPNGTAPTLTATVGKIDTIVLYTYDAGAKWMGFVAGQNA